MNKLISHLEILFSRIIAPLEWVMLFVVIGGGVFLLFYSKFYPLTQIKKAFTLLLRNEKKKGISRFQALSAVLAATVGLGNISGVAIAIHMGGPGVLVWMWLTAIIGCIIKFFSCSLSVQFREQTPQGEPLGGPMYYMTLGIKKWGKPLAIWFSIAGFFGVLPAFTANQLTQTFINVVDPNQYLLLGDLRWKIVIGIVLSVISATVIFGGIKSIVRVTSSMVPLMVTLYFMMGLFIIIGNYSSFFPTIKLIFFEAFNTKTAVAGGFWGLIILGVRRAVFSNESGVGNAPMYHGQSQSSKGTDEGLVAMLGLSLIHI